MRSKIVFAAFLSLFLGACVQNNVSQTSRIVLRPAHLDAIIAFYEQYQTGKDTNESKIILAFGKSGFTWNAWQNLTKQYDFSTNFAMPLTFKSLFQGEHISTITTQANGYNPAFLNMISIEKGAKEVLMNSSSQLAFDRLLHSPVLMVNNMPVNAQSSWKKFTAGEKLIESTMPNFQSFVENGLLEKNRVRMDDLSVLDAIQLNDNAKILTLSINTLSNRDDLSKEKRYKSFYFNAKGEITDLTFEEDVRFEGASTGLNIRFLDAFEYNGEMMILFWIWDGSKTGYRLFRPNNNLKIDQWR